MNKRKLFIIIFFAVGKVHTIFVISWKDSSENCRNKNHFLTFFQKIPSSAIFFAIFLSINFKSVGIEESSI